MAFVVSRLWLLPTSIILLCMTDNLCIHIFGYQTREAYSDIDDLPGVESGKVAQNLVRAAHVSVMAVPRHVSLPEAHLGLFRMSPRINTSCATMHKMFKCGP